MITITVSNALDSFNYKTYFSDYHFGAGSGSPVFSGGSSGSEGSRISLNYDDAKVVLLDGEDFRYTLSNHYLSGRLEEVTYTEAGKSQVIITGLDVYTPVGKDEPLGSLVFSLMGDDPSGSGAADASPSLLLKTVAAEAQHFIGGKGTDSYAGTKFADVIEGNLGKDTLSGGAGKDTFQFDTKLGAANVDRITDFKVVDDTFKLDDSAFSKLKVGGLSASAFYEGTAAHDANDRIIYNEDSGALLYDADGSGNAKAVQFATVGKHLDMTSKDFLIF